MKAQGHAISKLGYTSGRTRTPGFKVFGHHAVQATLAPGMGLRGFIRRGYSPENRTLLVIACVLIDLIRSPFLYV